MAESKAADHTSGYIFSKVMGGMRLHDFILGNRERILSEWETFARTCAPASGTMDVGALRDHANTMLTVIVADLATPQDQGDVAEGPLVSYLRSAEEAARKHDGSRVLHNLQRECLSQHWFVDLADAQQTLDAWREDYNNHRPHSSLGQLPPVHFRSGGHFTPTRHRLQI